MVSREDIDRLNNPWKGIHRNDKAFHQGRAGDHLLIPFECEQCIFLKLRGHLPDYESHRDKLLIACLRRMNLDAFWSRETQTVKQNTKRAEKQIELSNLVGLENPFIYTTHLPDFDHCGYEVAVATLLYSRRPGKYHRTHVQFDTIRHLRSTFSNFVKSSPQSNQTTTALGDFKGNYQRLVTDACGSLFFKRFMEGLKKRMGQDWRPNTAISTKILIELLMKAEERISEGDDDETKHDWIVFSAYITIAYVISLRGPEGFLLDLEGLNRYWQQDPERYIVIALLGKVKGEHHDLAHLIPCTLRTISGINVKGILERLIEEKRRRGCIIGPGISDVRGTVWNSFIVNEMMHELLMEIFKSDRNLFPVNIMNKEKIREKYQCFRSLRRGSDTRAIEQKVDSKDIDVVNRWRTVEAAQGKRPNRSMMHHYAQLDQLIEPFLRYTREM